MLDSNLTVLNCPLLHVTYLLATDRKYIVCRRVKIFLSSCWRPGRKWVLPETSRGALSRQLNLALNVCQVQLVAFPPSPAGEIFDTFPFHSRSQRMILVSEYCSDRLGCFFFFFSKWLWQQKAAADPSILTKWGLEMCLFLPVGLVQPGVVVVNTVYRGDF